MARKKIKTPEAIPVESEMPPDIAEFLDRLKQHRVSERERDELVAAMALQGAINAQRAGMHKEAKDYLSLLTKRPSGLTNQILIAPQGQARVAQGNERPTFTTDLPVPRDLQRLALEALPDDVPETLPVPGASEVIEAEETDENEGKE